MNKIGIFLVLITLVLGCKQEPKDYVILKGKVNHIENPIDSVKVFKPDLYEKQIALNPDGSFSDTLKVNEGQYLMKIGDEYLQIYLKNGETITLESDYPKFDETLKFSGNGVGVNASNLYVDVMLTQEKYFDRDIKSLKELNETIDSVKLAYNQLKEKYTTVSPSVWKEVDGEFNQNLEGTEKFYKNRLESEKDTEGKPAPSFTYQNVNGENISLSDFKGKYVYIDVWATWCGPCKKEIPYLQKVEEEFKDQNIAFVSISVDKEQDKEKWKNFVTEKNLGGVQLFADKDWNSDFVKFYKIQGIPRFILIDPNGITVDADASRPSEPALGEQLKSLLQQKS